MRILVVGELLHTAAVKQADTLTHSGFSAF